MQNNKWQPNRTRNPSLFVGQRHYLNIEDFEDIMNEKGMEMLDITSI
jgi:hypothetical protein